jgi:hypothetical protein
MKGPEISPTLTPDRPMQNKLSINKEALAQASTTGDWWCLNFGFLANFAVSSSSLGGKSKDLNRKEREERPQSTRRNSN